MPELREFPKSSDFSPDIAQGRFELRAALELVDQGSSQFEEVRERFRAKYFFDSAPERNGLEREKAQNTRAGNVLSGMKAYGLIDGGKGQYSVSRSTLEELGLHGLPILAVAKGKNRHAGEEKIYHKEKEYILNKNDPLLFFIQRIKFQQT